MATLLTKRKIQKPPGKNSSRPNALKFTVASALLRELGERLVGKPHIALAELVKNGYDADATNVVITFVPGRIEVSDNGHGMSLNEFKNFWMRIGSPHKQKQRVSRELKRPMTGSKGVGRLAVQFLANKIEVRTVSKNNPTRELKAVVDWNRASQAGDLTEAEALYSVFPRETTFPQQKTYGTKIILTGLNQSWSSEDFKNLGSEIWWLQPPFQPNPELSSDQQRSFVVDLESPERAAVEKFDLQMRAVQELWHARLIGRLIDRKNKPSVQLSLQFANGEKTSWEYSALDLRPPKDIDNNQLPLKDWNLQFVQFEIRVFHLRYRQRFGIKVEQAQKYLNEHGGVHVYDAGFHLPYYGHDTDWLQAEKDHAHRLSTSKLLPESLQAHVARAMNFLPTMSRLLGVVHVDTAKERKEAKRLRKNESEALSIQVSRDRLVDNSAFRSLHDIVRAALDFYALEEAKRNFKEAEALKKTEPLREKFERVDTVLATYKPQIPTEVFQDLRNRVKDAIDASDAESKFVTQQIGLLGPLATAGISALAYEHEVAQQLSLLDEVNENLLSIQTRDRTIQRQLQRVTENLSEWIDRARASRALFSSLLNEENRNVRTRLKARSIAQQVGAEMRLLLRGVRMDFESVDDSIRLPSASFAEWSSVFQNVYINALNAMLDRKNKLISVKSNSHGRARSILVQDTGVGVDLPSSPDLFKPFVRRSKISQERQALGLGGTGLGLAIVKMIADNLDCKVAFVTPDAGFSTAFQISWSEAT